MKKNKKKAQDVKRSFRWNKEEDNRLVGLSKKEYKTPSYIIRKILGEHLKKSEND